MKFSETMGRTDTAHVCRIGDRLMTCPFKTPYPRDPRKPDQYTRSTTFCTVECPMIEPIRWTPVTMDGQEIPGTHFYKCGLKHAPDNPFAELVMESDTWIYATEEDFDIIGNMLAQTMMADDILKRGMEEFERMQDDKR